MTSDAELIAQAVAEAKEVAPDYSASFISGALLGRRDLRYAVARHLLSRDPEAVRVPLKGTVS